MRNDEKFRSANRDRAWLMVATGIALIAYAIVMALGAR